MLRNWLTKKATQTIETTVVAPAKKAITRSAETGSDWLANLLRLGIIGFLTLLAFREDPRSLTQDRLPEKAASVVVNNYIYESRGKDHDADR